MRFASLGSGSEGNALLIECGQHWEQAAEGRPTDHQLLLNAAEVLIHPMGQFDEAIALCVLFRREVPRDPDAELLNAEAPQWTRCWVIACDPI